MRTQIERKRRKADTGEHDGERPKLADCNLGEEE
jgi:hypothetical protein